MAIFTYLRHAFVIVYVIICSSVVTLQLLSWIEKVGLLSFHTW